MKMIVSTGSLEVLKYISECKLQKINQLIKLSQRILIKVQWEKMENTLIVFNAMFPLIDIIYC
jgi:hypothetical protein